MIDWTETKLLDKGLIDKYIKDGRRKKSTITYPSRDGSSDTTLHRIHNLQLKAAPKTTTLGGSLHSFHNALNGFTSGHPKHKWVNYNDFTYSDLLEIINWLERSLSYDLTQTSITLCEFGFNLKLDMSPKEFLENHVSMYKFRTPCKDPKYRDDMKIKKFELDDYYLKIYDKSLQFNLDENILRIEVGFKTDILRDYGIESLKDLTCTDKLDGLFGKMLNIYDDLLIVDRYDGCREMSGTEVRKIIKYTHPQHWIDLLGEKRYSTRSTHKAELQSLLQKYGLDSRKNYLRQLIIDEYRYLLYN
ncbi:MAG: hypothetical protein E6767_02920 [Dysgonomonas sp.]|nr:hypothetical protein [Dysgonomonas sp.]